MCNYEKIIKELIKKTTYMVSEECELMIVESHEKAEEDTSKIILESIIENIELSKHNMKPLCQSPGYGTFYIKFGQNFFIEEVEELVKKAIGELTKESLCRPSIVDPLTRKNNGDNSGYRAPNFEYEYSKGLEYVEVIASFKGCGVEVFNKMKVFTLPELGENYEGLKRFVLETVSEAGGKPCLPSAIGIGIGGQVDVAAKLSRKAISTRSWKERNKEKYISDMEEELLKEINSLNIGSGGLGGKTTALAVNIETAATHTAICPVVINFHCWAARRAGVRIYPDGRIERVQF